MSSDVATDDGIIRINYQPRKQFIDFHNRIQRFACIVAHRAAGKTMACIHDLQRGALRHANSGARFAYLAPFRSQAKQVAWDYLRAAAAPLAQLGTTAYESELRIDYPHCGGGVRLFGADNPDALRGLHLDGAVLDEPADMDPRTYPEIILPALAAKRGWVVFIGTPKGKNEFHKVYQQSKAEGDWYSLTLKASETHLISAEDLATARRQMTPEQYEQEYECSFDAAVMGTYYGKLMTTAEAEKRICVVPYDPAALVWTAWDIGIGDKTAIWWCQVIGRQVCILDYYEAAGADAAHYASVVRNKPYEYAGHFLPHDAEAREPGSGKSYTDYLGDLDIKPISIVPRLSPEHRINAARMLLPRCWFDANKCKIGLECLRMHRSEYDEKRKVFKNTPLHDWTSDGADAFGYLALMLDNRVVQKGFSRKIEYPELGVV